MSEEDIRNERLKKLRILQEAGMEAYPSSSKRTEEVAQFLSNFEKREEGGEAATLAGRIMSLRRQGGIIFADIYDGSGRVQIVLLESEVDKELYNLFTESVDIGDFIECTGIAYKTKRGERSLKVSSWRMLAKSLLPIPDEWYGVKDEETRLRQRYLDLLLNPDLRSLFVRRAKFWQSVRDFYLKRGFLEVETPILETSPGGADARPFVTHHNALDIDVFLRISGGELWQKELLIAGFPKVFEVGRIFRNEGQSREHLQDYTQVESYEAYKDMHEGMKFVQELYRHIVKEVYGQYSFTVGEHEIDFAAEWPIIDFSEKLKSRYKIDPRTCTDAEAITAARDAGLSFSDTPNKVRALDLLWKQLRKTISGPAFLVGVPVELEPLAKRSPSNPNQVERIQVIIAGSEVGKGYSELNDPLDQASRFEEQQKLREAGDEEAQRFDREFVRAMEYGMPPAFGFGVSERLFAFLENKPVHEAQLFPLMRPRSDDSS
ncbi:MAG: lysyl-tRNA synthetase [Parcubacteria group bacterium GW2011_GWA2_51_10]|nr:MAG: lysyl-tRNA synthetase [Parcubacteria group bacterium GW2011_GWA2_51_10]